MQFVVSPQPSARRHGSWWIDVFRMLVLIALAVLLIQGVYRIPRSAMIRMEAPPSLRLFQGFYAAEHFTERDQVYRWSDGQGRLWLPNPGGSTLVQTTLAGGPDAPTSLTIDTGASSMNVDVPAAFRRYTVLLPPSSGERITLTFASPSVWVNQRELGVVVGDLQLSGGGQAPWRLIGAVGAAALGVYLLLRGQGRSGRWLLLWLGIGLVLFALLLWLGGWQIGWWSPLLMAVAATSLTAALLERWSRFPQKWLGLLGGLLMLLSAFLLAWLPWLVIADQWPMGMPFSLALGTLGMYLLLRWLRFPVLLTVILLVVLLSVVVFVSLVYGWPASLVTQLWLFAGIGGGLLLLVNRIHWRPTANEAVPAWSRQDVYLLLLLCVVSLSIRVPWMAAPDPVGDLQLSARRLSVLTHQGMDDAYAGGNDYLPLRLYILYGLGAVAPSYVTVFQKPLLPETIVLLKLPSLLADLATLGVIYYWARRRFSRRRSAVISALYTLSPPIWINVAWWGQVDALLMFPLLLAVLLIGQSHGRWSWLSWAGGLLIKAQAIVLLPWVVVATFREYGIRRLIINGLMALGVLIALSLPLVFFGQGTALWEAYRGSVGRFTYVTEGAYNLWYLLLGGYRADDNEEILGNISYRMVGLLFLGTAVAVTCLSMLRRFDRLARAETAAVLMLAFFMLPTQIHQRYLFLSLAFLLLCLIEDERFVLPYLTLVCTATLNIIGDLSEFVPLAYDALEHTQVSFFVALVNLLVLLGLLGHLVIRAWRPVPSEPPEPVSSVANG